jgi:hypothetical protein
MMEAQQVRQAIAAKAASQNIDLSSPQHIFVVAKFTPQAQTQGPLLWAFDDQNEAQLFAERQRGDVYLMSGNPQHGLQMVQDGKLVFTDQGAAF